MISDLDLIELYFIKSGFSEQGKYLLYIRSIFSWSFNKWNIPLFCKSQSLLKCYFASTLTKNLLSLLVGFVADKDKI